MAQRKPGESLAAFNKRRRNAMRDFYDLNPDKTMDTSGAFNKVKMSKKRRGNATREQAQMNYGETRDSGGGDQPDTRDFDDFATTAIKAGVRKRK